MNDVVAGGSDWRDSLSSLTSLNGFMFVFNTQFPRTSGWPELRERSAEATLRAAAEGGNAFAMERLGLRLLFGEGLPAAPQEGEAWLRRSVAAGNPVAMHRLAEQLLGSDARAHAHEAEALLAAALAADYLPAQVALGAHLLEGTQLPHDGARGLGLLRDAAARSSRLAHLVLAACLIAGRGVPADRDAGIGWLKRLGGTAGLQVGGLAGYLHSKSLVLPSRERRRLSEYAAVLFAEAVRQGNVDDEVNLAYLIRRGEIGTETYPSLDALLEKHLAKHSVHALMNQALRLAGGVDCSVDWQAADALVARIVDPTSLMNWWLQRAHEGDAEGHLVVAWLARHQLVADPQRRTPAERLSDARAAGWEAPEWMNAPATPA